ncbi:xylan O-acetyltransferase 1-like [Magnolia sinica]|uniref:xylan O-acetyltransferase 1-like n=1 Tax=Magnolia sinica TaxID=86752 RepID=UPI00265B3873|nr:xylan O-acetyltransferase 1-like [Magnolia sinica]
MSFADLKMPSENINISINGTRESMKSNMKLSQTLHGIYDDASTSGPHGMCDIFDGRWVYDPTAYPLYQATQCPFLSDQVSCQKNGRPDSEYENWKWEARKCNIPRFDGREMLERWRGKRIIIVGDSLNRNQWESLSCLLYSVLPPTRVYVNVRRAVYKVFRAMDYNCTVEFFWSPFLVQMEELKQKVMKLDTISASAQQWRGADIMVFNTGHWWVHRGKLKAWDFFENEGKLVENMEVETAYEIAMKTWAHWIDHNVDPANTTVFFRSISPEHKRGKQWCYNQTQPIMDKSYVNHYPKRMIGIAESILGEMKIPVRYLNITKLSEYRRDAHAALYTARQGKPLTEEQRRQPKAHADCSHWCLPGLPDTWNTLMYASTVLETSEEIL